MTVVKVWKIPGQLERLCGKQNTTVGSTWMYRCDRKQDHEGKCSWELVEEIERLRAENVQLIGQVNVALGHT